MVVSKLIIQRLLRILTPYEINELTVMFDGENKRSLTDMVNNQFEKAMKKKADNNMGEILIFEKRLSEEQLEDVEKVEEEVDIDDCDENVMLEESQVAEQEVAKQEVSERVNTTVFILDQKEKFKKNQKKLKGREVMDTYKKEASVSIEQEKKNNHDLSRSTVSGILVNKKHG